LANRPLAEIITEMIDADRVCLPVHPELLGQVMASLADDGVGSSQLWALVGDDPSLICSLFRAANSSFYAGLPKTLSIDEAVTRLGLDKALRIVEETCRSSNGLIQGELLSRYMPSLWQHAQGCAVGARWLARRCGYLAIADQAYFAGLLHNIGKLVLLAAMQTVASDGDLEIELPEALVLEVISTTHVEQGLRLFDEWRLPEVYRTVVSEYHTEERDTQNIIVALVKLANKGCRKIGLGLEKSPDIVLPTTGEAQFLGIDEIALAEFEIMLEDRFLWGGAVIPGKMADFSNSAQATSFRL
jgi:HD-like signal output (HDOD) protein